MLVNSQPSTQSSEPDNGVLSSGDAPGNQPVAAGDTHVHGPTAGGDTAINGHAVAKQEPVAASNEAPTSAPPADEVDIDGPVHPKPRFTVSMEPAATEQVTTQPAVVETPAVVAPQATPPVDAPQVIAPPVEAPPVEAPPVVAPQAAAPRPLPVAKPMPVAKPLLVAKPVPMAKALAVAVPVAQALVAEAVPDSHIAEPVLEEAVGRAAPVESLDAVPPVVPLSLLTHWLWHIRNLLAATAASMFVHICVLLVLGNIWLHTPDKPKTPPPLEFSMTVALPPKIQPPKVEAIVIKPIAQVPSKVASKGSGAGSEGAEGGQGGGKVGGLNLAPIKVDAVEKLATGGSGFGTDKAYGDSMLGEVGELKDASATFFGVKATGRNFVFVVDTSGSMTKNDRYLRCRTELLRSIGALKYGQKYFVVFFNHTTFAMPERKLVEARPGQITKTQEWCKLALPAGGTEPWDGLAMALRMKPDAIYLLTDGDFNPDVIQRLAVAQPQTKKIPIHTICFESLSGALLLEAIAKQTNGTYLYVP